MPYPFDDDRDPNNPVEMSEEALAEFYDEVEDFERFLDNDHSMDY